VQDLQNKFFFLPLSRTENYLFQQIKISPRSASVFKTLDPDLNSLEMDADPKPCFGSKKIGQN